MAKRITYLPSEQAHRLLAKCKTLRGFWGGSTGNASTSGVIDYIVIDYLTTSANVTECSNCGSFLHLNSMPMPAGEEVIKCKACGTENSITHE